MEESAASVPMTNMTEKLKSRDLPPEKKSDGKEEVGEDIEDEVGEEYNDDQFDEIEDFYGTMDQKEKNQAKKEEEIKDEADGDEELDMDLDYSQTHLDDFLKS